MTTTTATSTEADVAMTRLLVATSQGVVGADGSVEMLHGRNVGSIAADPEGLWALVDHRELHRVDDEGSRLIATIDDGSGVFVRTGGGSVYVGGDQGKLWRLNETELVPVQSFSIAPSSEDWYTPWGGPPSVFSVAENAGDLYVSVHVGGILASSDGGRTWRPTIDLHDDVHQVATDQDGTIYAATGMNGLAESSDRGRSWHYHDRGLHATYLLTAAVSSQGVLVGASSGPRAVDGAVYLFDGHEFQPVEGLPGELNGAVGPRRLVADGDQAAVVVPGGAVYVSGDGGRTWTQAHGPLDSPTEPALRPIRSATAVS